MVFYQLLRRQQNTENIDIDLTSRFYKKSVTHFLAVVITFFYIFMLFYWLPQEKLANVSEDELNRIKSERDSAAEDCHRIDISFSDLHKR